MRASFCLVGRCLCEAARWAVVVAAGRRRRARWLRLAWRGEADGFTSAAVWRWAEARKRLRALVNTLLSSSSPSPVDLNSYASRSGLHYTAV